MASPIGEQECGLPWLSWAMTGVLTLAGVLVVGLVISAQHPPARPGPQAALPKSTLRGDTSAAAPTDKSAPATRTKAAHDTGAAPPVKQALPAVAEQIPDSPATSDSAEVKPSRTAPPATTASPAKSATLEVAPPPSEASHPDQTPPAAQAAPNAKKRAAYVKAVADIRRAMAQRNLAASKRLLKTAADNAQSDAQRAEVERLETIQDHLEQFWDEIRHAVAAMQPTDEIVLSESNRVAVIECSSKELTVQWEGRPRRYPIEALPMELLSAIAKATFKLMPGTKLVVGSFLAVDAHGDRKEARKLWREAIAGGEADGKLLLPELDVPAVKGR